VLPAPKLELVEQLTEHALLPPLPVAPLPPPPPPLPPPLPPPPPMRAPIGWDGKPVGPLRPARFEFPCIGPCHRTCAVGIFAQPHHDASFAGPRAWQRMCRACFLPLRVRALWAKVRRAHSSYVARVMARGLLRAHARAAERVYAPGGIGYVHARDEFVRASVKRARGEGGSSVPPYL